MSAHTTRVDWETAPPAADPGTALREGNRVLESVARQEALRSLLAFSELRASIRNRQSNPQSGLAADLFQTERFVLDEVLQLICDRALAITGADGVMIALADGSDFLCRAAAGSVLVERGARLTRVSEFLAECLDSGLVVRCDDSDTDSRVEFDLTRQLGALASVLVPLRGRHARLGVIQAFSKIPFAFSDGDIRTLDLFAELVLSALKPEDQDRRIHWLSNVAGEVVCAKPTPQIPVATAPPVVAPPAVEEPAKIKLKIDEPATPEPPAVVQETVPEVVIAVADFHFSAEQAAPQIEEKKTEAATVSRHPLPVCVDGPEFKAWAERSDWIDRRSGAVLVGRVVGHASARHRGH